MPEVVVRDGRLFVRAEDGSVREFDMIRHSATNTIEVSGRLGKQEIADLVAREVGMMLSERYRMLPVAAKANAD